MQTYTIGIYHFCTLPNTLLSLIPLSCFAIACFVLFCFAFCLPFFWKYFMLLFCFERFHLPATSTQLKSHAHIFISEKASNPHILFWGIVQKSPEHLNVATGHTHVRKLLKVHVRGELCNFWPRLTLRNVPFSKSTNSSFNEYVTD